jgi:hypothetical protein
MNIETLNHTNMKRKSIMWMLSGLCLLSMVLPLTSCGDDDEESKGDLSGITITNYEVTLVQDTTFVNDSNKPPKDLRKDGTLVYYPQQIPNVGLQGYFRYNSSTVGVLYGSFSDSILSHNPKKAIISGEFYGNQDFDFEYPFRLNFAITSMKIIQ